MNRKKWISFMLSLLLVVSYIPYGSQMTHAGETGTEWAEETAAESTGETDFVKDDSEMVDTDPKDTAGTGIIGESAVKTDDPDMTGSGVEWADAEISLSESEDVSETETPQAGMEDVSDAGSAEAEPTGFGSYGDEQKGQQQEVLKESKEIVEPERPGGPEKIVETEETGKPEEPGESKEFEEPEQPGESEDSEEPEEELLNDEAEEEAGSEHLLQSDTRTKVTKVTATSNYAASIKFGETIVQPEFMNINDGMGGKSGVGISSLSGNCDWTRLKDGTDESDPRNWVQKFAGNGVYTPGKWRVTCKLRIDGEYAKKYVLPDNVSLTVNGVKWNPLPDTYFCMDEFSQIMMWSDIIEITKPASGFYFLDDASYDIGPSVAGEPIPEFSVKGGVYGGSGNYRFLVPREVEGLEWLDVTTDGTVYGTPKKGTPAGTNYEAFPIKVIDDTGGHEATITIHVEPTRTCVTSVKATSNTKSVAVSGKKIKAPDFSITKGSTAYAGKIQWQKKKADGTWAAVADESGTFSAGEWRMTGQILIGNYPGSFDKWQDTKYYILKAPFTFQADGTPWTTSRQPYKVIAGNPDTLADVISPGIKITTAIGKTAISGITDKTYTGKAITQNPVLKEGSYTLKKGTDYTVSYKNNVQVGTATITLTGKGYYTGSVSKTFKIKAASTPAPTPAPTPVPTSVPAKIPIISYRTHVQTYGWQAWKMNGEMSGTEGQRKRLEGINIMLSNLPYAGGIDYRTHVQTYGWQGWKSDGEMAGTSGEAKRLEAIQIRLAGEIANHYDVYYQTHVQHFGWSGWAKNGEMCGSAGYAYRLEGIRILMVKKGDAAPGSPADAFHQKSGSSSSGVSKVSGALVGYNTHVQTYGWQEYVYDGKMAGTSGQAKRLEGIHIALVNKPYTGDIVYRTHVQTYGWQAWKKNGDMSGTSGEAKRLEGIQIYLTGEMAKHYDVYYRVHAQTYGWLDYAKNGVMAGTSGLAKRLEGINIVLVEKGGKAPGTTAKPYIVGGGGKLPDNPYMGT